MKKTIITLLLISVLAVSVSACGTQSSEKPSSGNSASSENKESIADPVSLLDAVWKTYSEEEKFPAGGGDFSEENNKQDAAGKYSLEDMESVDSMLGFPAASGDKVEDAASLMHMMNGNTFTAAAYKVKDGQDPSAVAADIKSNLSSRQWVCGCPDKLLIAVSGNYVVSAFGEAEIMNTFKEKLTSVYSSMKIEADEDIVIN